MILRHDYVISGLQPTTKPGGFSIKGKTVFIYPPVDLHVQMIYCTIKDDTIGWNMIYRQAFGYLFICQNRILIKLYVIQKK